MTGQRIDRVKSEEGRQGLVFGLLFRVAKQFGSGWVPVLDPTGVVHDDDRVGRIGERQRHALQRLGYLRLDRHFLVRRGLYRDDRIVRLTSNDSCLIGVAAWGRELMDNHVRPQADLLFCENALVPKFVGRMEHMRSHWRKLRHRMTLEGLPAVGRLPFKNVRRRERSDIHSLFSSTALSDRVLGMYERDFQTVYRDYSVEQLLQV